jgi:predicted nuclease of predicted toxin-antitoxin system
VKLLFDQNLSQRLVATLADEFPDCAHVRDFELQRADAEAAFLILP